MSDSRAMVATIFDSAARLANGLGDTISDSTAVAGLRIGAGLASVMSTLIKELGTEGARDAIAELVRRRDEGVIDDDAVETDNEKIKAAVAAMFDDEEGTPE